MDIKKIKADFPIFKQKINGNDLIYLDSAATTQKPVSVIDTLTKFYSNEYASIYRGVYQLAERATERYEAVRSSVARYVNADPDEIIFTRGSTAGINFIATAWARQAVKAGDEILVSELEHHANLVPWQQVGHHTGAKLNFIPITPKGVLDYSSLHELLTEKTKLVAITWCSNAIGTHVDLAPVIKRAHEVGAKVLVDATQAAAHRRMDLEKLGADFLVFSAHKMLGPTGLGVLYINKKWHDEVPPYQFGGGMIFDVTWHDATWRKSPLKYEGGTPPIAEVISFGATIEYLNTIDFQWLEHHEAALCRQLIEGLEAYERVRILGPVEELKQEGHLVSMAIDGIHPHDAAAYFDQFGICVRAGNHCARPLHVKLGIDTSLRASFYLYNSANDVEILLDKFKSMLAQI